LKYFNFPDFKAEEKAINDLKETVSRYKLSLSKGKTYPSGNFWYNDGNKERFIQMLSMMPTSNTTYSTGVNYHMVPERLNCIGLSYYMKDSGKERAPVITPAIWVPKGTKCTYQFVALVTSGGRFPDAVFVLDTMDIITPKALIFCQNQKNLKNINPIKSGKCPKGSVKVS
jgi:hypothetical protein